MQVLLSWPLATYFHQGLRQLLQHAFFTRFPGRQKSRAESTAEIRPNCCALMFETILCFLCLMLRLLKCQNSLPLIYSHFSLYFFSIITYIFNYYLIPWTRIPVQFVYPLPQLDTYLLHKAPNDIATPNLLSTVKPFGR